MGTEPRWWDNFDLVPSSVYQRLATLAILPVVTLTSAGSTGRTAFPDRSSEFTQCQALGNIGVECRRVVDSCVAGLLA
jgi:hypothetical protein